MLRNHRFLGTWELVSFESRAANGTVSYPMGPDPVGLIMCDETGHVSAQLGPRGGDGRGYVAYFGLAEADDAAEGTLVTRVAGGSSERFRADQVRRFAFTGDDELVLSPPPGTDGTLMVLVWRRLKPRT